MLQTTYRALESFPIWCGTISVFAGVAYFLYAIIARTGNRQLEGGNAWEIKELRRVKLRSGSWTYYLCEPWIEELAPLTKHLLEQRRLPRLVSLGAVTRSLNRGGARLPWSASDYLSALMIESMAVTVLAGAALLLRWPAGLAAVAGVGCGLGYAWLSLHRLQRRAEKRMRSIRNRLPFAVDLMAVMMEAGASFQHSLDTLVTELHSHPLGQEFGRVLRQVSGGQPLRTALHALHERLQDPEIESLVRSTLIAVELGTPQSEAYLRLARQMRQGRLQRAEAAVGRAQAMISLPGGLIMFACMIIVITPFVIQAGHLFVH
jgi:Flp pilus assembly protein TadB